MIMISCAQEGEDYGKGVIFYLRENKVTIGTIISKSTLSVLILIKF